MRTVRGIGMLILLVSGWLVVGHAQSPSPRRSAGDDLRAVFEAPPD